MRTIAEISRDLVAAGRALEAHGWTNVANLTLEELAAVSARGAELRRHYWSLKAEQELWERTPKDGRKTGEGGQDA